MSAEVPANVSIAADHHVRGAVLVLLPDLLEQLNRGAVGVGQCLRCVAKPGPPIRTGAPCGALEDQAGAEPPGDLGVRPEVFEQRLAPLSSLEQLERREVRQLETVVENQSRLDAAIGQKEAAGHLRQRRSISCRHQSARRIIVAQMLPIAPSRHAPPRRTVRALRRTSDARCARRHDGWRLAASRQSRPTSCTATRSRSARVQ
jgi:hypothetical protein